MSEGGGPSTPVQDKRELRRVLRGRRRETAAARDLAADATALGTRVLDALPEAKGGTVLSYESLPQEPPTTALNPALRAAGWRVLVPITLPDLDLDWCDLADVDRRPLGIAAPTGATAAVLPGLAVDASGTRLGQGGGCYDRVLPRLPEGTPVLVLLHPGELHEGTLPREPHDQPVPCVVTAEATTRTAG